MPQTASTIGTGGDEAYRAAVPPLFSRGGCHVIWSLTCTRLQLWTEDRLVGLAWWLAEPILLSLCYVFMVKLAFRAGGPNYALFLMTAMLPWFWLLRGTHLALESLRRGSRVVKAYYINYAVFPTAEVLATAIRFGFSLPVLIPLMIYYGVSPTVALFWLPLIVLCQLVFVLGIGYWLSVGRIYIQGIQDFWKIFTRIWFFMSPCLYSADDLPERIRNWYMLNPVAVLFSAYRDVLIEGHAPEIGHLGYFTALALVIAATGLLLMRRQQGVLSLQI